MRILSSHTRHTAITASLWAATTVVMTFFILAPALAQQSMPPSVQTEGQTAPAKVRIGDTTTSILQTQADGSMAGGALPILGPTATLSWQRYLESYKHPIPETFTRRLDEIGKR